MNITVIDKARYDGYEGCRQIIHHSHARKFGQIDLGGRAGVFAIAWRSDVVEPVAVFGPGLCCWLGVDQRIAAVELATGRVLLSLGLGSSVLQIKFAKEEATVIACETEITVLNLCNSLRSVHEIIDIDKQVDIADGVIYVTTLNNGRREIRI